MTELGYVAELRNLEDRHKALQARHAEVVKELTDTRLRFARFVASLEEDSVPSPAWNRAA